MSDSTVRIPVWARGGVLVAHALVDPVDAAQSDHRWHLHNKGYVVRRLPSGRYLRLHRVILGLGPGDGLEGDHVNRDKLDNRRSNLRVVTRAQNAQNRPSGFGASRFRGVCWHKGSRKWQASAKVGGQYFYLGLFEQEADAAAVSAAFRADRMPFATE